MKIKSPEEVYLDFFAKDNVLSKDQLLSIFNASDFKPVMLAYANQFIEEAVSKVGDSEKQSILDLKELNQ